MIVTGNRHRLNPGRNQKIDHHRFHFRLSRLKIISANENLPFLCKFNHSWNKCVLRGPIDVTAIFQYRGNSENCGRGDFLFASLYGFQKGFGGVVDSFFDGREALRVRSPKYHNFIQGVFFFETPDVAPHLFHLFPLRTFQHIVCPFDLIRGDELREVNGRQRLQLFHVGDQLLLQREIQNSASFHRIGQIQTRYVPPSNDQIIWVGHWDHVSQGNVDAVSFDVIAKSYG
mmetsp:Transcript_13445/g.18989  ORF Transcript_13445/g.18989 Transcript_13445/m.18989 type:complete len:230 (-) Transcript_13445:409-1098(-)